MSDAYNFGGNTPGMGTADPNLWARLWGYVHPQAPPAAGPQTGPAGPITPGGSVVSAVNPPPVTPPIGGGPGNAMEAPTGTPAAAIPPTATASVPRPAAPMPGGSPFVQLDRGQNADVTGGPLSRGGSPQMSALDLSHLFGGGQPAAAAAAPARVNIPPAAAAAAPPVNSTPSAQQVVPPGRQSMTPAELAGAVQKPNWWQGLGRQDMTPDQLARAIKKPNWWQNT